MIAGVHHEKTRDAKKAYLRRGPAVPQRVRRELGRHHRDPLGDVVLFSKVAIRGGADRRSKIRTGGRNACRSKICASGRNACRSKIRARGSGKRWNQ
ncbi:hypothetical protein ACTI_25400 [Actinoplanes sp. OR16]|nr:hypothetical protein ACTI_25400 [Actinoplanes sp. OR16]